eukprot:TRINITY_DN13402_c0_g1_i1.p1 TRINITY_DN13402_c0_g1~~TRINITY_DN13402_c0_g1_i1.p1  ORF type:complete len:389 (-),score=57.76 TRINITY_DN13402_c0_g1_i1:700-1866(-)
MAPGKDGQSCLLYHEPQVDALCGVHCLNSLLQGPCFTEFDLASLAQNLDSKEREMMMVGGVDSADYLRYMAEDSGNVAEDGNFSIQVLSQALEVWGLRCISLDSPDGADANDSPQDEQAFICHLQAHWFAIRKVKGEWYNFNSLNPAPEHLSQFYLSAYLATLRSAGWTILVVRGIFPRMPSEQSSTSSAPSGGAYGRWMSPEEAKQRTDLAKVARESAMLPQNGRGGANQWQQGGGNAWGNSGALSGNDDEADMARAMAASLADMHDDNSGSHAFNPYTQPSRKPGTSASQPTPSPATNDSATAAASSHEVVLCMRLPTGQRVVQRFPASATIAEVAAFAASQLGGTSSEGYRLSLAGHPMKVLEDHSLCLEAAGVANRSMLIVSAR